MKVVQKCFPDFFAALSELPKSPSSTKKIFMLLYQNVSLAIVIQLGCVGLDRDWVDRTGKYMLTL